MPRKATVKSVASYEDVKTEAELLKMALDEKVAEAREAAKAHKAKIDAAGNELNAWESLQSEIKAAAWLAELVKDLPVDFGKLSAQAEVGVSNARVDLQHKVAEREVDPMFKLHVAVVTHAKAEKAEAEKRAKEAQTKVRDEMDAQNKALATEWKQGEKWATILLHAKDKLIERAKIAAHKGLDKGVHASRKDVHAALVRAIAGYLVSEGMRESTMVGDAVVKSPVFDTYLKEVAVYADPPMAAKPGTVAGNVRAGQRGGNKRHGNASNPKGNKRQDTGAEKPEVEADVPSVAAINAELGSKEGESMADFGFEQAEGYGQE